MTLTITIEMDNAAFGDTMESFKEQAGLILKEYSHKLLYDDVSNSHTLRDINRNTVGKAEISK